MIKLLSYPISAIYYLLFGFLLVFFHPVQWICFNLFGYEAHKKSVGLLNGLLIVNTWVLGTRYIVRGLDNIPLGIPLIIVSNHQSLYDIPLFIWYLRKVHPKFVSKRELGRGIPSVSYNLRHGGSVLIDRNDSRQSLQEIRKLGEYIEKHQRSAVIFPEGTRSRDGNPKRFAENGTKILSKYAPSAHILPVTINNSWKLVKYGSFPLGLGVKMEMDIHPSIPVEGAEFEIIYKKTVDQIKSAIKKC
jgi:1-acyl-sn-glycerol-3-phosphate acyltransferase